MRIILITASILCFITPLYALRPPLEIVNEDMVRKNEVERIRQIINYVEDGLKKKKLSPKRALEIMEDNIEIVESMDDSILEIKFNRLLDILYSVRNEEDSVTIASKLFGDAIRRFKNNAVVIEDYIEEIWTLGESDPDMFEEKEMLVATLETLANRLALAMRSKLVGNVMIPTLKDVIRRFRNYSSPDIAKVYTDFIGELEVMLAIIEYAERTDRLYLFGQEGDKYRLTASAI